MEIAEVNQEVWNLRPLTSHGNYSLVVTMYTLYVFAFVMKRAKFKNTEQLKTIVFA